MTYNGEKLGCFIVPTGVGASIGGYAGDASCYARKFTEISRLIVNPNVVNAGGFSGINDKMFYVEGYTLDDFFKGKINLLPSKNNKIGIIYDKSIPQDVLNIHINTQNAVSTVYGTNIKGYEITEEPAGVEFFVTDDGVSLGNVKNISTVENAAEKLLQNGCDALAIVCLFDDSFEDNPQYAQGAGTDPVGGVEAIISHDISKKFKVPCAHSPAFLDYAIYSDIVNPKSASEYITPTFLPCILLGLSQAPEISTDTNSGINIKNLDYLTMPYNSLGSTPVFECLKHGIKVYAVKENQTELDVTKEKLFKSYENIIEVQTYDELYNILLKD